MKTRYKLVIGWCGTPYRGWQRLGGGKIDKSIQYRLERAARLFHKDGTVPLIQGASRTDAGVHAIHAVANMDLNNEFDPMILKKAFNSHLIRKKELIWIESVEKKDLKWQSRSNNFKKYIYRVAFDSEFSLASMEQTQVWHIMGNVDTNAIREATRLFTGTHDFTGFTRNKCANPVKTKTIHQFELKESSSSWLADRYPNVKYYNFEVSADGFLYRQVRKMVGALVSLGLGRISEKTIIDALEQKDNSSIPLLAPAHGLYLHSVTYNDE